jgi:cytidylate kinase
VDVPVITVDGPGGVGKGTVSRGLADRLDWNYLDSGALYRILALAASDRGISLWDERALLALAKTVNIDFKNGAQLNGVAVESLIRSEQAGEYASRVAQHSKIRSFLLELQRGFLKPPGLVADGRDMGTTVFPHSPYKIYLIADAEERAKRRYKQLLEKGQNGNIAALFQDIQKRDQRDMNRKDSPLRPAEDACIIDTTHMGADEVLDKVIASLPFGLDKPI